MRTPRFSIGTLLAIIAILGVAMAALRSPSYLWAGVTFTLALLAVMAAVVCAVAARGVRRAYWLGFSLFGGTYLAICTVPGLHDTVCPRLATEALFDFIYPFMAPQDAALLVQPPIPGSFVFLPTIPPALPTRCLRRRRERPCRRFRSIHTSIHTTRSWRHSPPTRRPRRQRPCQFPRSRRRRPLST